MKNLQALAKELNTVMGLDPKIVTVKVTKVALAEAIVDAASEIEPTDVLTEESIATLATLGVGPDGKPLEVEDEKPAKPSRGKKTAEEIEEIEEVEDEKPVKAGKAEKPAKEGKTKPPVRPPHTTRMESTTSSILGYAGKKAVELETLAETADDDYQELGNDSNIKESRTSVRKILLVFKVLELTEDTGDSKTIKILK